MSLLYPLKFTPIIKEKIWGGNQFYHILNKDVDPTLKNGESWEISDLEGDISIINNGFLAENSLSELIELYMGELVGEQPFLQYGLGFPLLIKFIDASENLSVQVHPDDQLASTVYGLQGKTELWYVVHAEEGAGLYVGFNKSVKKEDFITALKQGTVDRLLTFYPVKKGDVFFIPAGTVHAIGKGVLLAEIQQTSDITFRVFDWNRKDENGDSRELHIEEALQAIHFEDTPDTYKIDYEDKLNSSVSVIRSSYFNINILSLDQAIEKTYLPVDSFVIYICVEGEVHFFNENIHEVIYRGETCLIPAILPELTIVPNGKSKLLEIYL